MTAMPKRNNKLVAWAVGAVMAAAAPTLLLFGAGPAQADDYGLLNAFNNGREEDGCGPVEANPALMAAAQQHADDIMKNGTKDGHTGSDGSNAASRATANGWTGSPPGEIQAGGMGEPASGQDVVSTAIDSWKGSSGHSLAFSDCQNTDGGAAIAYNSTGWTAVITAAHK